MKWPGPLERRLGVSVPEPRPGRRRALRLLGLAVLSGFAVLAMRHVDLRAVWSAMTAADPLLLVFAVGSNLLSLAAHSKRWAALVHPPGVRIRLRDALPPMLAGYAVGIVVPARAGDLVRAWLLARRTGLPTASVVAATALDFVIGAATLVPVLALLALTTPLPPWARMALGFFAAAAALGAFVTWLLRPPRGQGPPRAGSRTGLVARLRGGLSAAHDPGAIAASCGWGLVGWTAETLIAGFTLAALGLPASIESAGLAVVASTASNVVAISPGNAGPFELAAVLALGGLGVDRARALAFALLYHLVHLVPVALLGAIVLAREDRLRGPLERDALPGP